MKYITKSYQQTQKLGQDSAQEVLQLPAQKRAVVILLYGDLGGGKTTFLQGFAKGLGIKQKVLSPTFVIMKHFQVSSFRFRVSSFKSFYHIDCYRLKDYKDAQELGLKELFKKRENIIAIEWPERIKKILPKNAIKIKFKFINKNQRSIDI
jgi:tRNA threonylcarbamoyladenosine biosynthesis protein TsaE